MQDYAIHYAIKTVRPDPVLRNPLLDLHLLDQGPIGHVDLITERILEGIDTLPRDQRDDFVFIVEMSSVQLGSLITRPLNLDSCSSSNLRSFDDIDRFMIDLNRGDLPQSDDIAFTGFFILSHDSDWCTGT